MNLMELMVMELHEIVEDLMDVDGVMIEYMDNLKAFHSSKLNFIVSYFFY